MKKKNIVSIYEDYIRNFISNDEDIALSHLYESYYFFEKGCFAYKKGEDPFQGPALFSIAKSEAEKAAPEIIEDIKKYENPLISKIIKEKKKRKPKRKKEILVSFDKAISETFLTEKKIRFNLFKAYWLLRSGIRLNKYGDYEGAKENFDEIFSYLPQKKRFLNLLNDFKEFYNKFIENAIEKSIDIPNYSYQEE